MNYGEIVKEMRKARGYSQEELVFGIASRTTLSAFENNSTRPTFDSIMEYLDRLNVNLEEFVYLSSKDKIMVKKKIANDVIEAVMTKNNTAANNILIELESFYNQTKDIFFNLNKAQLIILLNEFNLRNDDDVDQYKQLILDHLNKVESWGKMEVSLFSNVLFIIPSDYILNVFKNSSKKFELMKSLYAMENIEMKLKTNSITVFLKRKEYVHASKFLSEIGNYSKNNLYHRSIHKYQANLLDYVKNNDEKILIENEKLFSFLTMIKADGLRFELEQFQNTVISRRSSEHYK